MILQLALVGLGGFGGAILRFVISKSLNQPSFAMPIGTIVVNLLGSFFLGIIIGMNLGGMAGLLIGTGFLGSFTTYSTFKMELIQLHFKKYSREFVLYILITYVSGIGVALLGYFVGTHYL